MSEAEQFLVKKSANDYRERRRQIIEEQRKKQKEQHYVEHLSLKRKHYKIPRTGKCICGGKMIFAFYNWHCIKKMNEELKTHDLELKELKTKEKGDSNSRPI